MGSVAPDGLRSIRNNPADSLYLGSPYAEALTFLCAPVTVPRNVKIFVSPAGLGKTVLLQSALSQVAAHARFAYVAVANQDAPALLATVLKEIGSREAAPRDLVTARQQFQSILKALPPTVSEFILAIDDAHQLSAASLEAIGTLLDLEGPRSQPVTLILAGLPELQYRLADVRTKKVRERIAGVMTLEPLNAQQKDEYVRYRRGSATANPVPPEVAAALNRTEGYPPLLDQVIATELPTEQARRAVLRFDRPPMRPLAPDPPATPTAVVEEETAEAPPTSTETAEPENLEMLSATSTPRSRWERLGWPAIFAIAACLLLPLVSVVFYLTSSARSNHPDGPPAASSAPPTPATAAPDSTAPVATNPATPTSSERSLSIESLRVPVQVGDPESQYKLGIALADLHNTADLVYGYAWLVMARASGQPVDNERLRAIAQKLKPKDILDVRYRLGSMYEKGIGCQADPVTADTWYLLAASAGDARSRAASARLEKIMPAPQKDDAHQRAAEWTRNHTPLHP